MADTWEALMSECAQCHECALCQNRKNVVFGVGNPQSEIMFVGEGPGANEDEQGIPFVGKAGMLLDDMLAIIGLDRTKVYIANIVKCRPPGNRDPLNVEQDACIGYLRRQIAANLQLRHAPEIQWALDDSITYGAKMLELINSLGIKQDDEDEE